MVRFLTSEMALGGLDSLFERIEHNVELSFYEVNDLFAACEIANSAQECIWRLMEKNIDRGIEKTELHSFLEDLEQVLEKGRNAFSAAAGIIKDVPLETEEKRGYLSALDSVAENAAEKLKELESLRCWLESPRRKIDRATLPKKTDMQVSNEYIPLNELTARLIDGEEN